MRTPEEELIDSGWKSEDSLWSHPLLPEYPVCSFNAWIAQPFVKAALARLETAVVLIRAWHGMGFQVCGSVSRDVRAQMERDAWHLYYAHAPEMRAIREALGSEGEIQGDAG